MPTHAVYIHYSVQPPLCINIKYIHNCYLCFWARHKHSRYDVFLQCFFYDVFFLLFFQTHDCGFYFARLYYCIGNLGALFLRCFLCADLNVVRINIIPACVYLCTAGNIGVLFVHENIGIYECFLYIFHCTK